MAEEKKSDLNLILQRASLITRLNAALGYLYCHGPASNHEAVREAIELIRLQPVAQPDSVAPKSHRWDEDGERCLDCGDKDWMGGMCTPSVPARVLAPVRDDAWDRNAEALTRAAGLGGGSINPNATSVMDLFLPDAARQDDHDGSTPD